MPPELQRTVVIEMPQSMYHYLSGLAARSSMTLSDMLIMSTLANSINDAAEQQLPMVVADLVNL
jgi:hypothetical protein